MAMVLDPVVKVGDLCVAALCRVDTGVAAVGQGIAGWGQKTPVALLIRDPSGRRVMTPQGAPMTDEAIEALSPGVLARFDAACRRTGAD